MKNIVHTLLRSSIVLLLFAIFASAQTNLSGTRLKLEKVEAKRIDGLSRNVFFEITPTIESSCGNYFTQNLKFSNPGSCGLTLLAHRIHKNIGTTDFIVELDHLELGSLTGYEQRIEVFVTEKNNRIYKGNSSKVPEKKYKTDAYFTWGGESNLTGTLVVPIPQSSPNSMIEIPVNLSFDLKLSLQNFEIDSSNQIVTPLH